MELKSIADVMETELDDDLMERLWRLREMAATVYAEAEDLRLSAYCDDYDPERASPSVAHDPSPRTNCIQYFRDSMETAELCLRSAIELTDGTRTFNELADARYGAYPPAEDGRNDDDTDNADADAL